MSFDHIARPVRLVVRQTNGPLAIVADAGDFYWIVNRENGKTAPERLDRLEAAKGEASTLSSLEWPGSPSPKWTGPVTGVSAEKRFERWTGR
jgi:hypothetical protein